MLLVPFTMLRQTEAQKLAKLLQLFVMVNTVEIGFQIQRFLQQMQSNILA